MTIYFSDFFDGIPLTCGIEAGRIVSLRFEKGSDTPDPDDVSAALWEKARGELAEFFAGKRRAFDLPHRTAGTPFRISVWEELKRIPYGEMRTYGELANALGRPKAARAVGQACHDNPIVILIPCHRVVGSGGALTGFAAGTDIKRTLLELEGAREEKVHGQSIFKYRDRI